MGGPAFTLVFLYAIVMRFLRAGWCRPYPSARWRRLTCLWRMPWTVPWALVMLKLPEACTATRPVWVPAFLPDETTARTRSPWHSRRTAWFLACAGGKPCLSVRAWVPRPVQLTVSAMVSSLPTAGASRVAPQCPPGGLHGGVPQLLRPAQDLRGPSRCEPFHRSAALAWSQGMQARTRLDKRSVPPQERGRT